MIKNGKIRIIAGKWKGRTIPVINQATVRPTTSRIRETLFNWLDPVIKHAICLDCFTGSGALGLESLSRGAQKVTFIDKRYVCTASLMQTILNLQNNQKSQIIHSDCRSWLKQSHNTYNIIFIDPPFHQHYLILEVIWLLEQYHHFKTQSWIYIETLNSSNYFENYCNNFLKHWVLYRKKNTRSLLILLYYRDKPMFAIQNKSNHF